MYLFLALLLLALVSWPISGANIDDVAYCSSQNTGTSLANSSIYQSNGNCEKYCSDDYAFAILQGKNCWCSNLVPASGANTDSSKCDSGCPGYPDDPCGSETDDLFVYIEMSLNMPTGTATLSTTSATSASTSSTSSTTSTDSASTNAAVSITDTVTVTATTSSRSTPATETTTSATDATTTAGPSSTVDIQTIGGVVKTVTVGSTSTSESDASNIGTTSSSDSGMSGGTIAGIVVGTIGGVAAILALIFVVFLMRRRSRASSPDPSVQNGLIDGGNGRGPQMGYANGVFSDNHSHSLSAGSSNAAHRVQTFTDDRMKTSAVLYPNGERGSSVSLQDNEDYSRPVLRLTNPD